MAHIERRENGRYRARYRGPDGKERSRTFDRKVDASNWLATMKADMLRGTYMDPVSGRTTLADYAARWLARMTPTWRPGTAEGVRNSLEHHILPVHGHRRLGTITKPDVEAFCASLNLAASTVKVVHQHYSQLLRAAVDDGIIMRNPATRARLPRQDAAKARPVPLEVLERVQAALPEWMAVVVALGTGAGLRQGEVSGLTVDRLEFLRRTLRVDRQFLTKTNRGFGLPKTESSNRTIPMPMFLVDTLAVHLRRYPPGEGEFGGLVLRTPQGLPLDSDRFGTNWARACRDAGSPGLRFHSLRHTFASTLLSNGVSIKAVSEWLGHANAVITLKTYAHLMPTDDEVARAVLDAAFAPVAASSRPAIAPSAL